MCRSLFPSHANFCALCGRPLVPAGRSPVFRNAGLALTFAISVLITYAVFAATRTVVATEERRFDLPPAKTAAMFELLKPRDVKVLVRKDTGRLHIVGTAKECEVLADFTRLITRHRGKPACEVRQCMEHARKSWTTREAYKLPKRRAKALFDALAPDDVPVLVSWKGKRVRVDADPGDQKIIRHIVTILRGRRL